MSQPEFTKDYFNALEKNVFLIDGIKAVISNKNCSRLIRDKLLQLIIDSANISSKDNPKQEVLVWWGISFIQRMKIQT